MIPSRRPTSLSQWKQLSRVCALNRSASHHGLKSKTRVPSSQIIVETKYAHFPLTAKEEVGRRSYATEARGRLSGLLSGSLTFILSRDNSANAESPLRQDPNSQQVFFLDMSLKSNANSPFTEAKLPVGLSGLQRSLESRLLQCIARQTTIRFM
jgi:hypothetical protein